MEALRRNRSDSGVLLELPRVYILDLLRPVIANENLRMVVLTSQELFRFIFGGYDIHRGIVLLSL